MEPNFLIGAVVSITLTVFSLVREKRHNLVFSSKVTYPKRGPKLFNASRLAVIDSFKFSYSSSIIVDVRDGVKIRSKIATSGIILQNKHSMFCNEISVDY